MSNSDLIKEMLAIAGGTSVVITGLAGFVGKIWAERILNREKSAYEEKLRYLQSSLDGTNKKLQAELDKGVHIYKMQFEKEFTIYQKIWEKLVDLKISTLSLRPSLDFVSPNETDEERKKNRLERFAESISSFGKCMEINRPFYAEEIFKELEELWRLTHREAIEYQHKDSNKMEYWEKADEQREKIIVKIEVICLKIRSRIGSVKVTE